MSDSNRSLSDSDSQNSLSWKRNLQRFFVFLGETDISSKDYETTSCMAWSMDQNWESRSESRKTRMEKREATTRQCSTTERNLLHQSGWPLNTKIFSKLRKEIWKGQWTQPCRAKRRFTSNRKLAAEVTASHNHKVPKTIYRWRVESHESTRQRVERFPPRTTRRPHCRQVYSYATSDENYGCKSSSG